MIDEIDHPLSEPIRQWVSERLGIPTKRVSDMVLVSVFDEVLREHGGIGGSVDGVVSVETGREQIELDIHFEDGTLTMSLDEFRDRADTKRS